MTFALWRNTTAGILWDFSYVVNTATRIAAGDVPYRDFPMVQAPLTFIVQALLIRLFGPHFVVQAAYAALTGGLATVLAYRISRWILADRIARADAIAFALCVPFIFLGTSSIFAHPWYDEDALWTSLVALTMVIAANETPGARRWLVAGALLAVPLFAKQNIGLGFLGSTYAVLGIVAAAHPERRPDVLRCAAGTLIALATAAAVIQLLVGLPEYVRWTVGSATSVRPPQVASVAWLLHPIALAAVGSGAVAVVLVRRATAVPLRLAAAVLAAVPLVAIAAATPLLPRAADLLWAIGLSGALVAMTAGLRSEQPSLGLLLPLVATGVAYGAWLTHGVSGSSRHIWPVLAIALSAIVGMVAKGTRPRGTGFPEAVALLIAVTVTVTGLGYTLSNWALSWADLQGARTASTYPSMLGFGAPGPYAADLDELLRWIEREVPVDDVIVFVPGEDPAYFALGRRPRVPSVLLDEASPYTPDRFAALAREAGLRWVFVKARQQVSPPWVLTDMIRSLTDGLTPVAHLAGYDVYRKP